MTTETEMKKSKHTPGPWLQEGNWVYAEGDPIRLSGGKEIRPNAFTLSVSPGPDRTREEAEANARLIAAAPELLEALECMIIGACAVAVLHNGERAVLQDAVNIARAAIAKAKGETQ